MIGAKIINAINKAQEELQKQINEIEEEERKKLEAKKQKKQEEKKEEENSNDN